MNTANALPRVAILLCTHNGERFLEAQLASIAAQNHNNWAVWASDDASTDSTLNILTQYQSTWGADRLQIVQGPRAGSSANFLSLACNPKVEADLFAYCDQDDVWHADKLQRAVSALDATDRSKPALYFSRSRLVDANGAVLGLSRLLNRPPSFRNALVQNIGGGNTMVFNAAARNIIAMAGSQISVVVHDWWTYMIVTGCGGQVISDTSPSLDYRQHGENQIGANQGLAAKVWRAGELVKGRYQAWMNVNMAALAAVENQFTPENRAILTAFRAARGAGLLGRLRGLRRSGIYRQSSLDNVGLYIAAVFNRF